MGAAAGNGTQAARLAGYKGSDHVLGVQSARMLTKASLQAAIAKQRDVLSSQSIADAKERREILTGIMRTEPEANARIRAVDVANKMDGLYVEKHEHSGEVVLRRIEDVYALPAPTPNS